jgi:glycosyltransferase involved in cell wall biosynthesis
MDGAAGLALSQPDALIPGQMHTNILVTHPYKHHALSLAAGCVRSGLSTAFAFPFYRHGLGAAVAMLPGSIGRKAGTYFHPALENARLLQSSWWQMRKLASLIGSNRRTIEGPYDAFVARQLLARRWRPDIVVTLQDHMPLTSAAAKQTGALLWSDQIINLSAAATARIDGHARASGAGGPLPHSEATNTRVLSMADIVTVPSAYTLRGVEERIPPQAQVHCVPYGADATRFNLPRSDRQDTFTIVARAHSVRKGGHLVLAALLRAHESWAKLVHPRRLRIVFLGSCETALGDLYAQARALKTVEVRGGDVPNSDVPALFAAADLFLMPTLSESMSLACIEAMSAGLPMIITEYAGVDCFVDGEMGVLIGDSVASVEQGVTRALSDLPRLAQWSLNVRTAATGLSWDHYEQGIAQVASQAHTSQLRIRSAS